MVFLIFIISFRSLCKPTHVCIDFLVIFILFEDKRIEDLTANDPRWYMKMDYVRHPRFARS